jgi:hypothetical protein
LGPGIDWRWSHTAFMLASAPAPATVNPVRLIVPDWPGNFRNVHQVRFATGRAVVSDEALDDLERFADRVMAGYDYPGAK